jgi:tetratricopeptide (TPR) repeat protein
MSAVRLRATDRSRVTIVPRGLHRLVWALLAVLCGAAPGVAAAQPPVVRQLVIPFDNATRAAQSYWLGEGSAVILTDDLVALGAPAITRDDRLRAFERLRVPAVATLSHATVIRLGQLLGAGEVIVGSFEVKGQDIIVRARPIRIDTGRMAPEIAESGPLAEIFAVYARIARRLVPGSGVSSEQMEQGHPPIAALEQYIKGLLAQAPATKISFLTQALRVHPRFERARIELWNVHTDLGDHKQALAAVRDVAPTHRLARQARFLSAVSLLHLGQYQPAFDAFATLNAAMPDPALMNNLGVVQLRRPAGAPGSRASAYFADATRIDSTDSDLFFNLGYAYWLDRDLPAAINALREAVRRNPADDAAHYVLGVALQASGSASEAAREKELARRLSSEYAEFEAKQPGGSTVPRGLERIKAEVDLPAALRVENNIVAAEQRDQRDLASFHLEAGRRAYRAERDAEAISALRRAVYLAPYQSEALLLLGRAYLRSGLIDEAIDALKIAIWSDDTIAAHLVLAAAYMQGRDDAAARSELQWILKADPQNAEARRQLRQQPPP